MSGYLLRSANIQYKIGDLLAQQMAAANLLGRSQIAREVHRKTGKVVPIATSSRFHSHLHPSFDEGDEDGAMGFNFRLPADGSASYLRSLTPVTKETFDGLSAQYKRDAFTVAGVSDVRLVEKIRDELAKTMQDGGTRQDFEKAVEQMTTKAGVAEVMSFTLDTVFTTNMHKAYALGRYEQLTEPDTIEVIPFWEYMTVGDDRVRLEHKVLDSFQARAIDPVWNKIYPPNGFNCRCIVIGLLASEAKESASQGGLLRLPIEAQLKVPTPGFSKVFPVAA